MPNFWHFFIIFFVLLQTLVLGVFMKGNSVCKIIAQSFNEFNKVWDKILASLVLVIGTIIGAFLFPLLGIFLSFFVFGFLCIGQKKFVLSCMKNKPLPVEIVFSTYKICIQAFAMKTIILLYTILWTLLLIVPGVICLINYSFSSFILADNEMLDAFSVLRKSKEMVYGYRLKIFIISTFSLLIFFAFSLAGFGIIELFSLFLIVPIWVIILITILFGLIGFALVVAPFYEISMAKLYLEAKDMNYVSKNRTKTKQVV